MSPINRKPWADLKLPPDQLKLAEAACKETYKKTYRPDYSDRLRSFSWEHPSLHRKRAMDVHELEFKTTYEAPPEEHLLGIILLYMQATRMKWGRSVQPTGELDGLAPVIGAMRIESSASAASYLGQLVLDAAEAGYMDLFEDLTKRIQKFATVTLGDHRNYQVWVAIAEILKSGAYAPSKNLARLLKEEKCPVGEVRLFPNSKEVKDYVAKHKKPRPGVFGNMPNPLDGKAWTRLWKESGAEAIIEKAARGTATNPRTSGRSRRNR